MNEEVPIKKTKEKQLKKTQSSSHLFLIPSKGNKKKTALSLVEVGLPDPIEEQQKILGRPTPCTVLAVSTTLFVLILLIIALGQLGLHDKSAFQWVKEDKENPRKQVPLPCVTPECIRYSAELLESINPEINPCSNFHEHVCSGFAPKNQNFQKLLKLAVSQSTSDHSKALKTVRIMLSKCALEESKELNRREQLGTIVSPLLPFPIFSINWNLNSHSSATNDSNSTFVHEHLTEVLIHISRHTPDDTGILGLTPSTDSEFSIFVIKPNSSSLTLYQLRNAVDVLKRHIPEDMLGNRNISENEYERQLNDILELQKKLKAVEFEARPGLILLKTIKEQMSHVDWDELIDSWYPTNGNNTVFGKVFGFNTTYYKEINDILSSTPSETVYNYLLLRFSFIFLRSELSSKLEETCLEQVAETVPGRIVLHGSAEPEAMELFNQMRPTIQTHMRRSLLDLEWMDASGIEIALMKLEKTKTIFGFEGEELIDELNIIENSSYAATLCQVLEWQTKNMFKSIAENTVSIFLNSDVFYSVERNEITISRSLLHYPFISSHLPNYTNFATVASKVIPQLIHIFDERGRFYDANGAHRDWWITLTNDNFRQVLRCFDSYVQHVFGVGITLGWNAYDSTEEPYAVLPGFNRSDTDLFFYSLGKTVCNTDPVKINAALASVPEFNLAFGCASTKKKNRKPMCKMAA
uniref:Peptidase_M13_N domain-containing protein n=1 Tax=Caenorhabditis tropicalis TaxID=1561998 RepID=A0A1I7TSR0_9PELO